LAIVVAVLPPLFLQIVRGTVLKKALMQLRLDGC